ncbi:hypothetical protein [Pedobacter heparinus]|uniref:Uncharacterized protein n=1 Tax=Pedobacter heparinus (strain ATCC 13125 / DSM 2366 / CIP 104194 / JCM 7457 / NBRC 12017 / NCIMB 9290 / NRRL B-14731 / HIM 762-3) TaxID=485917 RepID=C6XTM1_PEDHD|nr:hypothetical protein [Pedobacter heparinus]ACU05799.1 hypothetical protein Phep_3608 [Pedobacter heparinus DSM 2366]
MDLQKFLTDAAVLVIGGVATVSAGYYLIRDDIRNYFRLKFATQKKEENPQLLSLRLQAHERLIVFIERINPSNLFIRLHQQGISVQELQATILNEIRAEYQHNVTQQLYISSATWNVVKQLKDDTIAMVNNGVENLSPDATGVDLSRKILQHMTGIENNPYDLTLDLIKNDIHLLF